jgi:hypothetical protein
MWVSKLPGAPAVYALYGGKSKRNLHVAYVGIAKSLRTRIIQHLINRDSSVSTGISAVRLSPDYVTEIRWWTDPNFTDRSKRQAAEKIAFQVLRPPLASRGATTKQAQDLELDETFSKEMQSLFSGEPSGRIVVPDLQDALKMITELEKRIAILEKKLQ